MSKVSPHRIGELAVGVAAAFDLFDLPNELNEELLARVLRTIAAEVDDLGYRMFLNALAAALDDPEAELRLNLKRAHRGRRYKGSSMPRALTIGPYVQKLVEGGWKKEAAVQQAMTDMGLSRSTILRSCAEYDKLPDFLKRASESDEF